MFQIYGKYGIPVDNIQTQRKKKKTVENIWKKDEENILEYICIWYMCAEQKVWFYNIREIF